MIKKNEKVQNPQGKKPLEQPTTPTEQVELTDEQLGQVVGGNDGGITAGTTISPATSPRRYCPPA